MADTTAYQAVISSLPEGYLAGFADRLTKFVEVEVETLPAKYHVQVLVIVFTLVSHICRLSAATGNVKLQGDLGYTLGIVVQEAVEVGSERGIEDFATGAAEATKELDDLLTQLGIAR